jgi:hypothetical protein
MKLLLSVVSASAISGQFVPSTAPNMNGRSYGSSITPGGKPGLMPTQFSDYPGGVEYFDVYSPEIRTLYSQIHWAPLPPVELPADIVQRYAGKGMAIVGFEADQIRITPEGNKSVPISASYNHHYVTVMVGAKAKFVKTSFDGPDDPRIAQHYGVAHGVPWKEPHYLVEPAGDGSPGGLPSSQLFDGANGGEYRMSNHGVSPGHAIVVDSPTHLQITPMQIDTWNRDKMDIDGDGDAPPAFVAGPEPKASQAPPGASYSGLLECPMSTRVTKQFPPDFSMRLSGPCTNPITTADACKAAAAATLNNGDDMYSNFTFQTGTWLNNAPGCIVYANPNDTSVADVFFNTLLNSTVPCADKATQMTGTTKGLITTKITLDSTQDQVTIELTGPDGVWFGVGFDAGKMLDAPWTVLVDGAGKVEEMKLADHAAGAVLAPSVIVVSSTVTAGVRTVVVTRPLKGKTTDYYTFSTNPKKTTIPLINAVGSGPVLGYHKIKAPVFLTLMPYAGVGGCVCPAPAQPFGQGIGTITYNPTSQPEDIGSGSSGFHKPCRPEPYTDMLADENPTCDVRSYVGGMNTCQHHWSLLDADQEIPWVDQPLLLHHRYRFWVQPFNNVTTKSLVRSGNWGLGSPIELDVPKCAAGVKGCWQDETGMWIHTVKGADVHKGTLATIHFHCHAPTCLGMEMYMCSNTTTIADCNETTGELKCAQYPIYGDGSGKFEEEGYVKINPCFWGDAKYGLEPPLELDGRPIFLTKSSNATVGHYGEMATTQVYLFAD